MLADPIRHLINCSLRESAAPELWKLADVIPVPKSTPISFDELRQISSLFPPAKLLDKIVITSLRDLISKHDDPRQYAYKKRSSSTMLLIDLLNQITSLLDNDNIDYLILHSYDFSKAFDRIPHHLLTQRLEQMHFPSGFLIWLTSNLSNIRLQVRLGTLRSSIRDVTSGVSQESLLEPALFALYISDLAPDDNRNFFWKYADDVTGLYPVTRDQLPTTEYDTILKWSVDNDLPLNVRKCH